MKPSDVLRSHSAAIRSVVEAHRARDASVFGSLLQGLDTERSDLGILIDLTPETRLFDIGAIRQNPSNSWAPVDVLKPNALPDKFRAMARAEAHSI